MPMTQPLLNCWNYLQLNLNEMGH